MRCGWSGARALAAINEPSSSARRGRITDFSIRRWAPNDPMAVSPPRDEYFPILYSTVSSKRTATFGTDLNSEFVRSEAISRARDGNTIATAQGIMLRPIKGIREGFLAVIPAYRHGLPQDTLEDRRRNTLGVIVGAFQTAAVFDSIVRKAKLPQQVDLYVYPSNAGTKGQPVYMRGAASREHALEPKSEAALAGLPSWSAALNAGDASWKLVVTPVQPGLIGYYRAWLVATAVILVFAGLLAYMWASLRHARRLEHANSRILDLAQTDLLTNLPNRRAFVKRLTMAFTASWRGAPHFAVLYLDIDDLKDVNDTLGHAMGDLLLKEIVNRLRSAVRPDDLVARFGGDEFAIFLPNVTDPATAGDLAARIGKLLAAPSASKVTRSASPPASASPSIPPTLPAPKR